MTGHGAPDLALLESLLLGRRGRREGGEIRFLCPAHDDSHPSARWNRQKAAWFCDVCRHGGGWLDLARRLGVADQVIGEVIGQHGAAVRAPVGSGLLTTTGAADAAGGAGNLPTDAAGHGPEGAGADIVAAAASAGDGAHGEVSPGSRGAAPRPGAAPGQARPHRGLVATYRYTDGAGQLLYEVLRFAPKSFSCRRPDGTGGWAWNLQGVRRVLYRLPAVLAAVAAGELVLFVEGEKDADALTALGFTATTHPGGAGKWRPEYGEPLRGARLVVLPDNDDAGRRHGAAVVAGARPWAAEVCVLELPGLPPKGDVSDWLEARRAEGLSEVQLRCRLLELCLEAVDVSGDGAHGGGGADPSGGRSGGGGGGGAGPAEGNGAARGAGMAGSGEDRGAAKVVAGAGMAAASGDSGDDAGGDTSASTTVSIAGMHGIEGGAAVEGRPAGPGHRGAATPGDGGGAAGDGAAAHREAVVAKAAVAAKGTGSTAGAAAADARPLAAAPGAGGPLSAFRCLADIAPQPVTFLWKPYLPIGKLTLLEGDPGQGKSWLTAVIAAAGSRGGGLPGMPSCAPFRTLFLTAEDGLADTLRPRIDALGGDCSAIFTCDQPLSLAREGDLATLEAALAAIGPRLVVIDPLIAFLGTATDMYRANEVRAVLAPLIRLMERYGCALLAVRHLNKAKLGRSLYAGQGSIDFTAAARSVLLAGCADEDGGAHALLHIKSNLSAPGPSLAYRLRPAFEWTGTTRLTAGDLLAAAATGDETSADDEARDFLRTTLAGPAPLPARLVLSAAREAGISERTLKRAKRREAVRTTRSGFGAGSVWLWSLPAAGGGGAEDGAAEHGDGADGWYAQPELPLSVGVPGMEPAEGGQDAEEGRTKTWPPSPTGVEGPAADGADAGGLSAADAGGLTAADASPWSATRGGGTPGRSGAEKEDPPASGWPAAPPEGNRPGAESGSDALRARSWPLAEPRGGGHAAGGGGSARGAGGDEARARAWPSSPAAVGIGTVTPGASPPQPPGQAAARGATAGAAASVAASLTPSAAAAEESGP